MTTTHDAFSWVAGDDCDIRATLLDQDDNPYDLTTATIMWCMMDAHGQRVLDVADVVISVLDAAAGKCSIVIPAAKTSPLAGGRYSDVIRIIIDGVTSTLSFGIINVTTDPWAVPIASAAVVPPAASTRLVNFRTARAA